MRDNGVMPASDVLTLSVLCLGVGLTFLLSPKWGWAFVSLGTVGLVVYYAMLRHPGLSGWTEIIGSVLVMAGVGAAITHIKKRKHQVVPVLVNDGPGNIPEMYIHSGQPLGEKRLTLFIVGISNKQTDAIRVARNVRASLLYEHEQDRFTVPNAAWIVFSGELMRGFSDRVDLEPGQMQKLILSARHREGNGFICYATRSGENGLTPTQPLRFGRWTVTGTIETDYGEPLDLTATFNIDSDGNLVGLRSPGE
jgi:hypothetical protein